MLPIVQQEQTFFLAYQPLAYGHVGVLQIWRTFSGANTFVVLSHVVVPSVSTLQFSGSILWCVEDIHDCLYDYQLHVFDPVTSKSHMGITKAKIAK